MIDQNITDFKIKEKSVVKLLFSMNVHAVATPEMSLDEARSYVIFCREGQQRISAYIALHFLHTDRRLFYVFATNPFPDGELPDVENEARNFAEGLGAMLDEIDFSKMSDLEKDSWIEDQPLFGQKRQLEAAPAASEASDAQASPAPQPASASGAEAPAALAQPVPMEQPAPSQLAPVPEAPATAPPVSPAAPVFQATVVQPPPSGPPAVEVPVSFEDDVQDEQTVESPSQTKSSEPSPGVSPLAAAAKKRQEIMQKAVKAGVIKAPKQSSKKESPSLTGVVSRDREALARLFTSF